MLMAMMRIRVMRMLMRHPLMAVLMSVSCISGDRSGMRMLMVLIMNVHMFVLERNMRVLVRVLLGQMKPDTRGH